MHNCLKQPSGDSTGDDREYLMVRSLAAALKLSFKYATQKSGNVGLWVHSSVGGTAAGIQVPGLPTDHCFPPFLERPRRIKGYCPGCPYWLVKGLAKSWPTAERHCLPVSQKRFLYAAFLSHPGNVILQNCFSCCIFQPRPCKFLGNRFFSSWPGAIWHWQSTSLQLIVQYNLPVANGTYM